MPVIANCSNALLTDFYVRYFQILSFMHSVVFIDLNSCAGFGLVLLKL